MSKSKIPEDNNIIDATHRFGNEHGIEVHDESAGAEVIPISEYDPDFAEAEEHGVKIAGLPDMERVKNYLASNTQPPEHDSNHVEQKRGRKLTKSIISGLGGIFATLVEMQTAASDDKTRTKRTNADNQREFMPTYEDQRRRHQKHGVTPDKAS